MLAVLLKNILLKQNIHDNVMINNFTPVSKVQKAGKQDGPCSGSGTSQWRHFDDDIVTKVFNPDQFIKEKFTDRTPYLIFYVKINVMGHYYSRLI